MLIRTARSLAPNRFRFNTSFSRQNHSERPYTNKRKWQSWATEPVGDFDDLPVVRYFPKTRAFIAASRQFILMNLLRFPNVAKQLAVYFTKIIERGGLGKWITEVSLKPLTNAFSAGSTVEEAVDFAKQFKNQQILLDYAEEMILDERKRLAVNQELLDLIKELSHTSIRYVPLKLTAIFDHKILEKLSCDEPLDFIEAFILESYIKDLENIVTTANRYGKTILIDQEYPHQAKAIFKISLDLMQKYNIERPVIYITIQASNRDSFQFLKELSENPSIKFPAVKLVNGAYVDWAKENGHSDKIFNSKTESFTAFVMIAKYCLTKNISLYMGTHNLILEQVIDAIAKENNVRSADYIKGQLYGFTTKNDSDSLYVIFGSTSACAAYSLRRVVEGANGFVMKPSPFLTHKQFYEILQYSNLHILLTPIEINLINEATHFHTQIVRKNLAQENLISTMRFNQKQKEMSVVNSENDAVTDVTISKVGKNDTTQLKETKTMQLKTMQLKLVVILNKDQELKKVLNGLGHMTFGLGHRLDQIPDINVVFGSTEQVREFRTIASQLNKESNNMTAFTDFPHTMVGMSTDNLLQQVAATPESEVTYFGCCFVAENIDPRLIKITHNCFKLQGYSPRVETKEINLKAFQAGEDNLNPSPMKISLLFNTKTKLVQAINEAIVACLKLGKAIPLQDQRLLNVKGEGETAYGLTNISFHSLIVATTGDKTFVSMSKAATESKSVTNYGNGDVLIAYGTKVDLEKIITAKSSRLYSSTFKENPLVPIEVPKETLLVAEDVPLNKSIDMPVVAQMDQMYISPISQPATESNAKEIVIGDDLKTPAINPPVSHGSGEPKSPR